MARNKQTDHVHQYIRLTSKSGYIRFRCVIPLCSHVIAKDIVLGRAARCPKCDSVFIMDKRAAELKRPHCIFCTKQSKNTEAINKLLALVNPS